MKISFDLGKNGHHRPSGLGYRSIVVVRQADKTVAVYDFVKSDIFSSGTHLSCLVRSILLITL